LELVVLAVVVLLVDTLPVLVVVALVVFVEETDEVAVRVMTIVLVLREVGDIVVVPLAVFDGGAERVTLGDDDPVLEA
jgi:EamA domain-containing membrane protein RarD